MARKKPKIEISEQEAASYDVKLLINQGYDVYYEVEMTGGVADIVCKVRQPASPIPEEIWVIEVKTNWSLDLLQQCIDRKQYCHRVFAAVPAHKMYDRIWAGRAVLFEQLNVGVIKIHRLDWPEHTEATFGRMPKPFAGPLPYPIKLEEGHKTHAQPGAIGAGGRWTPFRDTCEKLAKLVEEKPGVLLSEAVKLIKHHYSSDGAARSGLSHWTEKGKVAGVSIKMEEGRYHLYPKDYVKP